MSDLEKVVQIGEEITRIKDLDLLMEGILTVVRRFVNADAGSIYLKKEDQLEFTYTQNETLQQRLPKGEKLIYNTFRLPIDNKTIAGYVANTGRELNAKTYTTCLQIAPAYSGKSSISSRTIARNPCSHCP